MYRDYGPNNTIKIQQLVKPNIFYRIDATLRAFIQIGWALDNNKTYEVYGHIQGIHENIFTYGNIRQQQYYFEMANKDFSQKIIIVSDLESPVAYDYINALANIEGFMDIVVFEIYERSVDGKLSPGGSVRFEDEWQSIERKYSDQEIPKNKASEYFRKLARDVDRRIQINYKNILESWSEGKSKKVVKTLQEKLF